MARGVVCLLLLLGITGPLPSAEVTLAWDPPTDGVTVGYLLQYGLAPKTYPSQVDVGLVTQYTLTGLAPATTYYFVVRAYNATGVISGPSNEVSETTPATPVPVVTITNPASGTVFSPSEPISIAATATGLTAGSYTVTVSVTHASGTTTSAPVAFTVSATERVNVARAQGTVVTVSSQHSQPGFGATGLTNGDRKGTGWGAEGGWVDGTPNQFPDHIELQFSTSKTVNEVILFSVQDQYATPVEPTPTLTFTQYGVRDFQVQRWDGKTWIAIPGATVTGNTLVWRAMTFPAVTTTGLRVVITATADNWSRAVEVEAWTPSGG